MRARKAAFPMAFAASTTSRRAIDGAASMTCSHYSKVLLIRIKGLFVPAWCNGLRKGPFELIRIAGTDRPFV